MVKERGRRHGPEDGASRTSPRARGTAGSEGAGLGIPAPCAGTAVHLSRGEAGKRLSAASSTHPRPPPPRSPSSTPGGGPGDGVGPVVVLAAGPRAQRGRPGSGRAHASASGRAGAGLSPPPKTPHLRSFRADLLPTEKVSLSASKIPCVLAPAPANPNQLLILASPAPRSDRGWTFPFSTPWGLLRGGGHRHSPSPWALCPLRTGGTRG